MLFVRHEFNLFYSDMGWDGCTRFLCVVVGVFLTRICEADEIVQSGQFSLFFFDVTQCSVLCWDGKLRFAVLPPSKPSWDEFGLSFCDVNQISAFC